MKDKIDKSLLITGIILMIIGVGIILGLFFYFGPFLGVLFIIPGSILFSKEVFYKKPQKVISLLSIIINVSIILITSQLAYYLWN